MSVAIYIYVGVNKIRFNTIRFSVIRNSLKKRFGRARGMESRYKLLNGERLDIPMIIVLVKNKIADQWGCGRKPLNVPLL